MLWFIMCTMGMERIDEHCFTIRAGISPGIVALLVFILSMTTLIWIEVKVGTDFGGISGISISLFFTWLYS